MLAPRIVTAPTSVNTAGVALECHRGRLGIVATVAERIEAVMAELGIGQRELARRAGFTSPSQAGNTLRRIAARPDSVEVKTLARIAKGLEVHLRWLQHGEGPKHLEDAGPDPAGGDVTPRFENLSVWRQLLEMAQALAPEIPAWVWPIVAESHPLSTVPITPGVVVELARTVMRHVPPPAPTQKR